MTDMEHLIAAGLRILWSRRMGVSPDLGVPVRDVKTECEHYLAILKIEEKNDSRRSETSGEGDS